MIELSPNGIRAGELVAGDTVEVTLAQSLALAPGAKVRCMVLSPNPPATSRVLACSGELSAESLATSMCLCTQEMRAFLRNAGVAESRPCLVEIDDMQNGINLARFSCRVYNSRLLWGGQIDALPSDAIGATKADVDGALAKIDALSAALASHIKDRENPHQTTSEQVGAVSGTYNAETEDYEMQKGLTIRRSLGVSGNVGVSGALTSTQSAVLHWFGTALFNGSFLIMGEDGIYRLSVRDGAIIVTPMA